MKECCDYTSTSSFLVIDFKDTRVYEILRKNSKEYSFWCFLRQCLTSEPLLAQSKLCRLDWPRTHSNPPAFAVLSTVIIGVHQHTHFFFFKYSVRSKGIQVVEWNWEDKEGYEWELGKESKLHGSVVVCQHYGWMLRPQVCWARTLPLSYIASTGDKNLEMRSSGRQVKKFIGELQG